MMPQGFLVNVTWHAESRQKCWSSGPWMILQVAEVTQIHQILGLFLANCQPAMRGISAVVSQKCSRLANQIVVHIRILLHHWQKKNIKKVLELKRRFPTSINAWHFRCFCHPKSLVGSSLIFRDLSDQNLPQLVSYRGYKPGSDRVKWISLGIHLWN